MSWVESMSEDHISRKIYSKKNFISKSEVNAILLEIHNLMLTKIDNKLLKKTNLSQMNACYEFIKKKKEWTDIYNKFNKLKTIHSILIPKVLKTAKKMFKKNKIRILTKGLRVIEKSSLRTYPIHQEYPGMKSKSFLVFWISLHEIKKLYGGLLVSKKVINKPLTHVLDKKKYNILKKQNYWKKQTFEKTFSTGELLTIGKYVQHGTAPKKLGSPRWSCIIRVGL